jgi:hypothetical protein
MATRISQRDLEAISAYLDGQLSGKEQARLDARLQADADLRIALDRMRRTRSMLRSMPRLRAPRNYVLTPQMVRRKAPPPAYPVLRLASVLATFLFVLVLAGDLLTTSTPGPAAVLQAPPTQEVALMEAAPEEPAERAAAPAGADASEESARAIEPAPPSGTPEMEVFQAAPAAEAQPEVEAPAAALAGTPVPETEQFTPPPTVQAEADTAAAAEQSAPARTLPFADATFLTLEIVLLLVALATGLAAFYLRRSVGS